MSSGSASGSNSGRKSKRSKSSSSTFALAPDAAGALNKARRFVEESGDSKARRFADEATPAVTVAGLPAELKGLVQRALVADQVNSKGEHRRSRSLVPAVIERLRDVLVRDISQALEDYKSSDMSGRSELPVKTAKALAEDIRRMKLSIVDAIKAVQSARGGRAPAVGSMLELQDACGACCEQGSRS